MKLYICALWSICLFQASTFCATGRIASTGFKPVTILEIEKFQEVVLQDPSTSYHKKAIIIIEAAIVDEDGNFLYPDVYKKALRNMKAWCTEKNNTRLKKILSGQTDATQNLQHNIRELFKRACPTASEPSSMITSDNEAGESAAGTSSSEYIFSENS